MLAETQLLLLLLLLFFFFFFFYCILFFYYYYFFFTPKGTAYTYHLILILQSTVAFHMCTCTPKINKISHRISTPMWLVSFMLHSCVIVMGKSISGSYEYNSFGQTKWWFVLFHILFFFLYTLLHMF